MVLSGAHRDFSRGHDQFGFVLHLLLRDFQLFLEGPELVILINDAVLQALVLPGQAKLGLLQFLDFLLLLLYDFPFPSFSSCREIF